VLSGKGKFEQDPIFPQNTTHQMVLAITGKLKMPDPNIVPPDVPRRKRWIGGDKGWDS
jgi:hypothetical protein